MIIKIEEAGYTSAMRGLALSHGKDPKDMPKVAEGLAPLDLGHNKCLEHIMTWWMITGPRYWWQEMDTYRLMSKQSASTMHTLIRDIKHLCFKRDAVITQETLGVLRSWFENAPRKVILTDLVEAALSNDLVRTKQLLPESFLQERECVISYQTLRRIILQRQNHKLPHWQTFCKEVRAQVEHPELLP